MPVYLALAVNALLMGAYLWSAGGATTHIRIEANEGIYRVWIDGKKQIEARCESYDRGATVVRVFSQNPGALPKPNGLDRLVVTNADSGSILLDDGPSAISGYQWTTSGDQWSSATFGDTSWQNYIVDAYFKNPVQGSITVHSPRPGNGIVYSFRPFRHFDNGLDFLSNGKVAKCPIASTSVGAEKDTTIGYVGPPGMEMSKVETLKSMLAMVLRPYPLLLATLGVMLAVVVVLRMAGVERLLRRLRPRHLSSAAGPFVLLIAAAALAVLVYISHNVNQGIPHVPDEASYVFQAKVLASFHFTAPAPSPAEAFDFFYPSLLVDSGGHWASIYPFGHPIMLAIGELAGAAWLVPPVLGALSILLIYAVGRQVYGARVGVVAAALLAFSPFFQMTASNLMSHNTAVFYILGCLALITAKWKRRSLAYGLAGVCFGLLLNTRPMTAVALTLPFALLFLSDFALGRGERMAIVRRSFAFAGGVMLMVGALYLYNLGTTGSLHMGYGNNSALETVVGFGAKNSVARGMQNEQADLAEPTGRTQWLAGICRTGAGPPALRPRQLAAAGTLFLLIAALFAIGVWTAYEGSGLMHGPRYWYEAIPFLMLLAARGLVILQDRLAGLAASIVPNAEATGPPVGIAGVFSYGLLVVLLGISVHGWILGQALRDAAK